MAQQIINIGSSPNDGAGDPLRTAFEKCNDNFTELYTTSGGGTGTVTSVSVNAANGVSASITNATTTPAMTFSLGNIVPATVNGITLSGSSTPSLAVTGATSVTGVNTGDQTITLSGDLSGSGSAGINATIANNAVTYAKMQQVAAISVVGNSTGSLANAGAITGSANQVLRVNATGSSLAFGALNLSAAGSITGTLGIASGGTGLSNAGLNNQYLKSNGVTASWAYLPAVSTNLWLSADEIKPRTSNGCSTATTESATNKVNTTELVFDQSIDEYSQVAVVMPSNYNGGTVTAKFHWTASSGSGDVVWAIQGRAFADGSNIDQAFGSAQTVIDTLTAANQVDITASTAAITLAGTPAAGNLVIFQIYRIGSTGPDTLTADARLLGVEISYTGA